MEKCVYAVAMLPTTFNGTEMRRRLDDGEILQRIFNDPTEAAAYAMENEWWPFVVERLPFQQGMSD